MDDILLKKKEVKVMRHSLVESVNTSLTISIPTHRMKPEVPLSDIFSVEVVRQLMIVLLVHSLVHLLPT